MNADCISNSEMDFQFRRGFYEKNLIVKYIRDIHGLTKAIGELTKYVQDQDNRIIKLIDRFDSVMEEDASHAPRVLHMAQEKEDLSTKQMIKFSDFDLIDVSSPLHIPMMNEVILKEKSLEERKSRGDHTDNEGWTLVTLQVMKRVK
ncbi:hypothetical protein RND71_023398 [Anisodus tanguticus]|uniref:Uncharacterized protein n=1 Tax=Anisodus tanguticus TaxID=243964 RepID=A0AAE1V613_9SOLA|nr:hypothetical protein RND71_023398 [Anisodus tanguticus]